MSHVYWPMALPLSPMPTGASLPLYTLHQAPDLPNSDDGASIAHLADADRPLAPPPPYGATGTFHPPQLALPQPVAAGRPQTVAVPMPRPETEQVGAFSSAHGVLVSSRLQTGRRPSRATGRSCKGHHKFGLAVVVLVGTFLGVWFGYVKRS